MTDSESTKATTELIERLSNNGSIQGPPRPPTPIEQKLESGDNGDMEASIAKLEVRTEHLLETTRELKGDIKELRSDMKDLRSDARTDFRLLFGAIIVTTLGVAGLMAKGFGWL